MKTVLNSNCCDGGLSQPIMRIRHVSPSLALSRQNAFKEPLSSFGDKINAVRYKCAMQRGTGKRGYDVKVGVTGSGSRVLQTLQGAGSAITPGNFSSTRSPVRSRIYSALTPGGGNLPGGFGALKPERGYRCPEGYQYGGRFTDSRFSTCGKQLFDLPGIIGQTIARILRGDPRSNFQRVSGRDVTALRDGFVLEPVVSPAVLRTIPDNRDMEGATFVMNAILGDDIGNDELGLLSNSGVENVTYVLAGGSTLTIRKARPLTVGERRKLGKTISAAEKTKRGEDPVERLRMVAAEMGDAIAYEESFENISNPNEIISVNLPGGRGKKQMRRWMYETFYRKKKKSNRVSRESQMELIPEEEKIKDLASAVRHLNNGGSLENISANIRSEAINRSGLYKTGKIKNGVMMHERADGQTVFEITPEKQYEHLGAAFASELQRWMGLPAPKVRLAGSGKKRNYMLGEAQDVPESGAQDRATDISAMPAEDVAGILISDFLSDTVNRNPSTIAPIRIGGRMRAVSSLNANSGLAGMNASEISQRRQMDVNDFFNIKQREIYRQYFEKLKETQRRKALVLFEQLMDRASDFDFRSFRRQLATDGILSEAEKLHLNILEKLFERRVDTLKASSSSMKTIIGLTSR